MKQLEFSVKETSKLPDGSTLLTKNMSDIMHDSMMPYAEYVIMDRAIPRVEDGLKPVQRRISRHESETGECRFGMRQRGCSPGSSEAVLFANAGCFEGKR